MTNKIYLGCLGVNEKNSDFLLGADINPEDYEDLPEQDTKRVAVNQNYGDYTMACTMMSSYSIILSLYNMEEKEEEKQAIIKQAVKEWYIIGEGWYLSNGVDIVRKTWNTLHPDKKVLTARTTPGSKEYNTAISKWYGCSMAYKISKDYNVDKLIDGVIDGKKFSNFIGGHAISTYKHNDYDWQHLNTYPTKKFNIYGVKSWYELIKSGTYYNSAYFFFKEKDDTIADLKKRKLIEEYKRIWSEIRKLSESQETKDMLHATNQYFTSKWF